MNAVENAHAWLHGDIDTDPRQLIKALLAVVETRAVPAGGCAPPVYVGELPAFQHRVFPWLIECFGPKVAADVTERCDRFIEEAFELVQSLGYDAARIDALKAYTWGRPPGEPTQEVGGVMVTLAALCGAANLDMHEAGEVELSRILQPEVLQRIREKQAAKARDIPFSPLPAAAVDLVSIPVLRDFKSNEPIGRLEIQRASLPEHATFTFSLGYMAKVARPQGSLQRNPDILPYELVSVAITPDQNYFEYLQQVGYGEVKS